MLFCEEVFIFDDLVLVSVCAWATTGGEGGIFIAGFLRRKQNSMIPTVNETVLMEELMSFAKCMFLKVKLDCYKTYLGRLADRIQMGVISKSRPPNLPSNLSELTGPPLSLSQQSMPSSHISIQIATSVYAI